ncbi:MAG: hypothetical protein WD825_00830 [Gemmatimonadaceae bacterium]
MLTAPLAAQQPTAAPAAPPLPIPAVGDMAPDFTNRAATRYGMLRDPVRLSGFRGQTVVLWFFVKARTRG